MKNKKGQQEQEPLSLGSFISQVMYVNGLKKCDSDDRDLWR